MAIRILFDSNHNPITPTILLANRSGKCYGMINNCYGLVVEDCFNDTPNFSLKVTKYDGLKVCNVWDKLVGLKLAYCVEWDMWFEIKVELDDGDGVIKTITFYGLGEAETSQIMLYDFQANTEDDIARDDYVPTVIYNEDNPKASLLNRIIDEKAPHYKIGHVDYSLRNIQRVFEFDDISIQEALLKIGTEIGALVVFDNSNDMLDNYHSKPKREISLYDLKNVCKECGERFDFGNSCPKCGGTNFTKPYGKDTPIFVSKDNLTEDIVFSTNVDSVKNCFRLVAGDDLMTATIKNCNPNGSQYIWYISDEMKSDMPDELVQKINSYNEMYDYYRNENIVELDEASVSAYNDLVEKYRAFDSSIPMMKSSICGFSELMEYVYNTIDFDLYLSTVLMETFKPSETNAALEASKLNSINLSPVAVSNITYISAATADNCVLEMARVLIDARYRVKINSSSFDKDTLTWTGNFYIERYSGEEDSATSNDCIVTIGDDYERYITQKIEKTMVKSDTSEYSISTVMKQDLVYSDGQFSGAFVDSIKKYSLMMLEVIRDCCQGCVDILIEQGIGNNSDETSSALYDSFYQKYYRRLRAIEKEQALRENEIAIIENVHGNILDERDKIQSELDFEKYLGSDLWKVFCSYRRDDKYENDNFISDGLSNAELFQNALEFISNAEKEIYKSATLQNSISATLHNLLFIKDFEKLVDYFEVGNWIRIEVDGNIYKLRLLKYSIDFDNPERIDVEFSDVEKYRNGITDVKSILDQASSMASSYSYVSRQSSKGKDAFNTIDGWTNEGMSLTATKIMNDAYNQDIVWDSHGMLFRKYDSISGDFEPTQLKIVNNTLAITDDYWETVKTAVGKFLYKNPKTGEIESAYGVNAETIVGTVILGEKLGIYNSTGTMSFDLNGFSVRNDKNEVLINPSADSIFTIKNEEADVLSFDANGNGTFTGNIVATSLELKPDVKIQTSNIDGLDEALGKVKSFTITLSNEYQVVSNYNSSIAIDTTVRTYYGNTDVTNNTTFTITKHGLDGNWNENEHIFEVTSLNEDNVYVEFSASYTDPTGEILTSKKRFNVSRVKDGIDGTNGSDGISIESITEYYLATSERTGITTSTSGWTIEPQPISKDKKYLWNYEVISFNRGDDQVTEPRIVGVFGEDGVGIDHIVKKYLATEQSENVTTSTDGWSETPQVITPEKRFLWFYEETHFTDLTISATDPYIIGVYGTQGLQGIQGERGENGIPGTNGTDGKTSYFHIKYSSVASPTSSAQMSETPNVYIGTYVDYTETDSTDPSKYTWSKFQGSDGEDGIPGTNGIDGKTSYLHIKYSNDGGQTFTANSGEDVGDYIGQYVDFIQTDSSNVSDYTWKKIVGENGANGKDGVTYYTWIKYADDENGTNMSDDPFGKDFIGIAYNKTSSTKGTDASEYTWSKFVGSDGVPGTNGTDGKSYYTWIKYADDINGSNMSDDPTNKEYIGLAFNKESQEESSNPSDYKWNKYVGADGIPGENAKTWRMDLSDLLIVQQSDFSVNPTSIHVSTYEIDDSGAHEYQGKIKISISTDGSTWSVVDNTTSSVYTYILPNTYQYKYVKFELFSNNDFLLDVQTITVNHDIATIFDELSEKIESSAVNITETTDENGHTIKNVSVGTGIGQKQFSVIDTSDFIYTDIAIGSKDVADAEEAYGAGKSFLKISKDGLIQASNALIYGTVYASGGKFTDVQGVNIDITGRSSFGGSNGIVIDNGKVKFGSDVEIVFDIPDNVLTTGNFSTVITKDYINTLDVIAANVKAGAITANEIASNTITASEIDLSTLYVGSGGIRLDSSATISWGNVTGKPTIPTDVNQLSDASGQKWSTSIGNSWIQTTSVTAQNLTVNAANISGKLTASQIESIDIDTNNLVIKNKLYMVNTTYGGNPIELVECSGALDFLFKPWCYFNGGISDGLGSNGFTSNGMFATTIGCQGNIECGSNYLTSTCYVEAKNQYHSIQLRAGNAGNVGIRLDEDTSDACWLIYKDKNGNVQIPGFSGGGTVDLTGYATKSWVNSQGFLTSSSLSGYATQTYVGNQLSGSRTNIGVSYSANASLNAGGWAGLYNRSYGYLCWFDSSGSGAYIDNGVSYASNSDRRMKNDMGYLSENEAYTILNNLNIVRFRYKDKKLDKSEEIGIYAQDLRDLLLSNNLPNRSYIRVDEDRKEGDSSYDITLPEEGYKYSVDYRKFIPLLWRGWQIHTDKIEKQSDEIANLKTRCERLEYMLEQAFERIAKL